MTEGRRRQVFITGVSSGLGQALAQAYLDQDWVVYGLSRRAPADLLGDKRFHFARIDLAQLAAIEAPLTKLIAGSQEFDLMVLNAGVLGSFGDMTAVPLSTMQQVMDINLWANKVILDTLVTAEIRLPQVVAISSGASTSGSRGWNAYGISKAALNMLVKLYANELPQTHFCALAPGLIDTRMQDYLCALEPAGEFQTLSILRGKRKTPEMPTPAAAAEKLMAAFPEILGKVASGEFADLRTLQ